MLSIRDALTGPWAISWFGYVNSILPAGFVIVIQELGTEYPRPAAAWIFASFLLQTAAVGIWGAVLATVSRRLLGGTPLPVIATLWAGIGILRGVVGGAVAAVAGLDPEWVYRVAFWVAVTAVWMPLITYAAGKADERRRLLALRESLDSGLADARARRDESDAARAHRIGLAIADAVGPALDEVRAQLRDARDESLDAVRDRVAAVARSVRELVVAPPAPEMPLPRPASVMRAFAEVETRRPWFSAMLGSVAAAPFLLSEALRDQGWTYAVEVLLGLLIATASFAGAVSAIGSRFRGSALARVTQSRLLLLSAGGLGAVPLAAAVATPGEGRDWPVLLAFPLVVFTAVGILNTVIALHESNVDMTAEIRAREAAIAAIARQNSDADARAAARYAELVTGELSGRLASCAMAIAFLAEVPPESPERSARVAALVEQLDAAASAVDAVVTR